MAKKINQEDIEKGIKNLLKVIDRQKEEIVELKLKLVEYEGMDVLEAWNKLEVTDVEALVVIGMFTRHIKLAREHDGNDN